MAYSWPVIGHKKIIQFLQKSIEGGKISHAYLFYGPENLGKKSMAKYFTQTLMCQADAKNIKKPCGCCQNCQQFIKNIHPDVIWVRREADKKNISIDQIRDLKEKISLSGFTNGYKVVIIVNAEEMNKDAANSFLKILEEPPQKSVIILLANKLSSIPETILSRCQVIKFAPVKRTEIAKAIKEEYKISQSQADEIASMAVGLPGRANKFLRNKDFFNNFLADQKLLLKILELGIVERLKIVKEVAEAEEVNKIILRWKTLARDLMLLKTNNEELVINQPLKNKIKKIVGNYSFEKINFLACSLNNLSFYLDQNINARLALDNFVINI